MGLKTWLLGGTDKTPGDFAQDAQYAHEPQITGLINQGLAGLPNRAAPQLASGPQQQVRGMQMQQANQLQRIAGGQQQGAGELAVQRQMQNALAGQQAMARMRGAGGGGMLAAARNSAGIGLNAAGMGQQAAMQDQMNAQGLLQNALAGTRGQDIGMAGQNASLQQNQMQLNDQQYMALLQSLTGMDANKLAAQMSMYQTAQGQQGMLGPLLSAGGQIGGAAMMASDERLKTDITDSGAEVDAMLDALRPYRYRYTDDKFGKGPRAGIMAQDLERSTAGKDLVTETPEGKMLDVNKTLSATLAMNAQLNKRVRALEGKG